MIALYIFGIIVLGLTAQLIAAITYDKLGSPFNWSNIRTAYSVILLMMWFFIIGFGIVSIVRYLS